MRKLKSEDILKNIKDFDDNELENIDKSNLDKKVVEYFKNRYELLFRNGNNINLLYMPVKEYEIFELDGYDGKLVLASTFDLPEGKNKEIYYSYDIASKIYQKLIDIKDSSFNMYDEVEELYRSEITKIEDEIEELKNADSKKFQKDCEAYEIISSTLLYEEYRLLKKDNNNLLKENEKLSKNINECNNKIRSLSKKLKISLDRVEELQELQKSKKLKNKIRFLVNKGGNI